jgi:hypothetical protein
LQNRLDRVIYNTIMSIDKENVFNSCKTKVLKSNPFVGVFSDNFADYVRTRKLTLRFVFFN